MPVPCADVRCFAEGAETASLGNAIRSIRHPALNPKSPGAASSRMIPARLRTVKICPQCKMRYPNEATYCFVEGSDLIVLPDPRIGTLLAGRYVIEEVV